MGFGMNVASNVFANKLINSFGRGKTLNSSKKRNERINDERDALWRRMYMRRLFEKEGKMPYFKLLKFDALRASFRLGEISHIEFWEGLDRLDNEGESP